MLGADEVARFCSWCLKSTKNTISKDVAMCSIFWFYSYSVKSTKSIKRNIHLISSGDVFQGSTALRADQTRTLKAEEIAPFILHFAYFIQCPPELRTTD